MPDAVTAKPGELVCRLRHTHGDSYKSTDGDTPQDTSDFTLTYHFEARVYGQDTLRLEGGATAVVKGLRIGVAKTPEPDKTYTTHFTAYRKLSCTADGCRPIVDKLKQSSDQVGPLRISVTAEALPDGDNGLKISVAFDLDLTVQTKITIGGSAVVASASEEKTYTTLKHVTEDAGLYTWYCQKFRVPEWIDDVRISPPPPHLPLPE